MKISVTTTLLMVLAMFNRANGQHCDAILAEAAGNNNNLSPCTAAYKCGDEPAVCGNWEGSAPCLGSLSICQGQGGTGTGLSGQDLIPPFPDDFMEDLQLPGNTQNEDDDDDDFSGLDTHCDDILLEAGHGSDCSSAYKCGDDPAVCGPIPSFVSCQGTLSICQSQGANSGLSFSTSSTSSQPETTTTTSSSSLFDWGTRMLLGKNRDSNTNFAAYCESVFEEVAETDCSLAYKCGDESAVCGYLPRQFICQEGHLRMCYKNYGLNTNDDDDDDDNFVGGEDSYDAYCRAALAEVGNSCSIVYKCHNKPAICAGRGSLTCRGTLRTCFSTNNNGNRGLRGMN